MFWALVRTRLASLTSSMFKNSKGGKKRSKGVTALLGLLLVYAFGCLCFMFGILFNTVCNPLFNSGLGWLYFGLASMLTIVFCFVGSVFATQTQLFEAKDNELLLSMPVSPKYILASRMVMLLILNYVYQLLILAPCAVVYCMNRPIEVSGEIIFAVAFILTPFLVMSISCLIGWLVALVNSKIRNKSLITTAFYLLFLFAYFYCYSKVSEYITAFINNGEAIGDAVKRYLFPVYHFGISIAESNFISILLYALCAIAPFALVYLILERSYIRIATERKGAAKLKYRQRALKEKTVKGALISKELRHLVSSPMYMLNSCLGVLFTLIIPVALLIKRDLVMNILNEMGIAQAEFTPFIGGMAVLLICYMETMNIVSAPSISLEGKNLWLMQSTPIEPSDVLLSKVYTHILVCLPTALLCSAVVAVVMPMSAAMMALLIITPAIFTAFQAFFGVCINLKFPKFDWINEVAAVKQSLSSVIAMLGSMGITTVPLIVFIVLMKSEITVSIELFTLIYAFVLALFVFLMYKYLTNKGRRVFAELS